MSVISQPESNTNSVNPDSEENSSQLKSSRRGYIENLAKCINRVTLLIDDMSNYDEVCLLCNKIEFEVFKIKYLTAKYCGLVSEEEIEKAKPLCNGQNKASQVKFQARFFESDQF